MDLTHLSLLVFLLRESLTDNPLVSVIDGSEPVARAVATVIRSAGFRVLVFPSAEKFILSDQMLRTACLVVNVQLTGMTGLQLQSHLAAAGRHIPMVFVATPADETGRTLARELAAVNVLDRPSGEKALLKEVCMNLKPQA